MEPNSTVKKSLQHYFYNILHVITNMYKYIYMCVCMYLAKMSHQLTIHNSTLITQATKDMYLAKMSYKLTTTTQTLITLVSRNMFFSALIAVFCINSLVDLKVISVSPVKKQLQSER